MASSALTREEGIGLAVSIAGHAALIAFLVMRPMAGTVVIPPERVEVTLSDDVGLTSTSPEPNAQAAADVAPVIGETARPVPAAVEPVPVRPAPFVQREPPRPVPRAVSRPQPRPSAKPSPPPRLASRPAPQQTARAGGSRIGSDFLEGARSAQSSGTSRNPPAQATGPQVQSSLLGAISREIKPHWQGKVPEGADSEKLVTILRWNLNRDGTLDGAPQLVRQEGITDANQPQAARHAEQAIRAVQLAAPFDLPQEHYNIWKRVTIRFDKRLSQ